MKIARIIFFIATVSSVIGCNNDDENSTPPEPETILLKVIGKGTVLGQPKNIVHPKTGEAFEANCFLMDLIDPDSGETVGSLEDCVLSMETPSDGTITSHVISSINVNGRGTVQAENFVFQELRAPMQDLVFDTSFTPTDNNVINTTFEFEGMEGTVSLEGEVNLSQLGDGIVTFNCLFTIELKNE